MGDRLFIGDWLFLGDRRGWSARVASGTRADSMVGTAAATGRAAANRSSRAGPLYPLRSWRQNGRLATHSPRHAHLRPPPRSHWLARRAGPRPPLWRRRREEEPRPWLWRQRRADKAGERGRCRPAPAESPESGACSSALLGKGSAAREKPKTRFWVRERNLDLGYRSRNTTLPCFPLFFSGLSYLPIHFCFPH